MKIDKVFKIVSTLLVSSGIMLVGSRAQAAVPFFADTFVGSSGAATFNSGIVTGPADIGGYFFPEPNIPGSFIDVGFFNTPIQDGPGIDLKIIDFGSLFSAPDETGDVFVSFNGIDFTFVGSVFGGDEEGDIDLAGLFAEPVKFVRLVNTVPNGPDENGIDLDTVAGFHPVPEPEPSIIVSLSMALGFGALMQRRSLKKRKRI